MRHAGSLAGFIFFLSWTAKADKPLYRAVGDEVVLTPGSVANPITSITWKHGPDMAMEWYEGKTSSYRQFKVRGTLNSLTGEMTITGLTQNDSGIYTAEINQRAVPKQTKLLVISPVRRPSISTRCDPEMTRCVFTCEGNTTDAEPITYKWGASDMNWTSTNTHTITKENKEPSFRCFMENPVSSEESEPVLNPLTQSFRNRIWMLTCLLPLVILFGFILYLFTHRKELSPAIPKTSNQDLTCAESPDTCNEMERSVLLQEPPNQTTSGASPESSNETVKLEIQEIPAQDSTSPVSPDTCNESEGSPAIPETSNQDSTCAESPDTCNETEGSVLLQEPPNQTTSGASPESSNETVKLELQEIPAQDSTSPVSPDTCNESEGSPAIPETSNQDSTCAESPDTCNETENRAVMSSGKETSGSQETRVD